MNVRGRLGWAAAGSVTTAVLLTGGAVAWASADQDEEDPPPATTEHAHEALPPYEERYAAASGEDQEAADDLIADVEATLTAFADVDDAVAAGYRPPRNRVTPVARCSTTPTRPSPRRATSSTPSDPTGSCT